MEMLSKILKGEEYSNNKFYENRRERIPGHENQGYYKMAKSSCIYIDKCSW